MFNGIILILGPELQVRAGLFVERVRYIGRSGIDRGDIYTLMRAKWDQSSGVSRSLGSGLSRI
jgi:hypothetical protein